MTQPTQRVENVWYPALCTDEQCPRVHRISDSERFHEGTLYIKVLEILADTGKGVQLQRRYHYSDKMLASNDIVDTVYDQTINLTQYAQETPDRTRILASICIHTLKSMLSEARKTS